MGKIYSSTEIIKLLKAEGWEAVRTKGSHWQFRHPSKPGIITCRTRSRR
jgi:predicted RNA binding protein YcfA (HicA-like mRNA interferase family)